MNFRLSNSESDYEIRLHSIEQLRKECRQNDQLATKRQNRKLHEDAANSLHVNMV